MALICKICNKELTNYRSLSYHIGKSHNDIGVINYYNTYINTDKSYRICHNEKCNNETKFDTLEKGYYKYCSSKCASSSEEVKNKRKNTNIIKYGTTTPLTNDIIKEKIKCIINDKYGVDHYSKTEEYKVKYKNTSIERFGVDNPSKNNDIKVKTKNTNIKKYGCNYSIQNTGVRNKTTNTLRIKYGVDNIFKNDHIKEKIKKTNLRKYGTEHPSQCDKIKEKIKNTCITKYGQFNPMKNNTVKISLRDSVFKKYGVYSYSKTKDYKFKYKNTCLNRYGVDNVSKSDHIKNKLRFINIRNHYLRLINSEHFNSKIIPLFTLDEYKGVEFKYKWRCIKCNNEFLDHLDNGHIPICRTCTPIIHGYSVGEIEVYNFISELFPDTIHKDRSVLNGKELDIYIPSKNIAIEYNGLYWHSIDVLNDKDYHINKTLECSKKNIQLIHIFEDEWLYKKEIVKSILRSKFGLINNVHYKECDIGVVNSNNASMFLNDNHINGSVDGINLGLYYNDELVSLLTYNKPISDESYDVEILRFCNKLNTIIINGLSKLINYIISNNSYRSILTCVDNRYDNGELYKSCGFIELNRSDPSYYYVINNKRYKDTELKNCNKIYDCGTTSFIYKV